MDAQLRRDLSTYIWEELPAFGESEENKWPISEDRKKQLVQNILEPIGKLVGSVMEQKSYSYKLERNNEANSRNLDPQDTDCGFYDSAVELQNLANDIKYLRDEDMNEWGRD